MCTHVQVEDIMSLPRMEVLYPEMFPDTFIKEKEAARQRLIRKKQRDQEARDKSQEDLKKASLLACNVLLVSSLSHAGIVVIYTCSSLLIYACMNACMNACM
jgi:hypothetical protein